MRILVTGANGDVGEAVGRILISEFPDADICGADSAGSWPAAFVFARVLQLPPASAPEYLDALGSCAGPFDLIIPTAEAELATLSRAPDVRNELPLLMVDSNIVRTFMDKYDTSVFFETHGIHSPRTKHVSAAAVADLPLYLKPRVGAGGRGHQLIATAAEFQLMREQYTDDWIVQEYLDGVENEFTCALARFGGDVRHITLRRKLRGGATAVGEVSTIVSVDAILRNIAEMIDLEGCINVQLKVTRDGPQVFEINPRLSSTVMMRHKLGFQDCLWWVRHFFGLPIGAYVVPVDGAMVYRMWSEHVLLERR
jgi:carbamoyl-phosphate synthase large subunit